MRLKSMACVLSFCAALCWNAMPAAAQSDSIAIGVVLPLTGDAAHWGIPPRNGAEMVVEEINHAGGIGGRQIALRVEGGRCDPGDWIAAVEEIVGSAKAPAGRCGRVTGV